MMCGLQPHDAPKGKLNLLGQDPLYSSSQRDELVLYYHVPRPIISYSYYPPH